MIVYKSRHFAMRRYEYGGSEIVEMIGSLLARNATTAMLTTVAKTATLTTIQRRLRTCSDTDKKLY